MMSFSRTRILKVAFALFLMVPVLLLNSCGGDSAEDDGRITLRYMRWGLPDEIEAERKLLKEFEAQNPDIKVVVEYTAWSQYWTKLQAQMASETAPDVFLLGGTYLYDYEHAAQLENLLPYVEQGSSVNLDDYFTAPVELFQFNDGMWALPRDCNTIGIYYNKTLFEENGVPLPTVDWTWDEFLSAAKTLTIDKNNDGRKDSFGYLASFESMEVHWISWVWQNGGQVLNAEKTECVLDQPESMEAMKWFGDLVNEHKVSPDTAQASTFGSNMFLTGRLAMSSEGSWMMRAFKQAEGFEWAVVPLPKGKTSVAPVNGLGNAMYAKSKHKEAAWKLIAFLSSETYQKNLAQSGTSIPAMKSIAYSDDYLSGDVEGKRLLLDQIEYSRPMPFTRSFEKWESEIRGELELVWLGNKEMDQAVIDATAKVNAVLQKVADN